MRFVYERGKMDRRKMHLQRFDEQGNALRSALCRIERTRPIDLNTSCNLPLGRPICRACLRRAREVRRGS